MEINREALEIMINGTADERKYIASKSFPLFFTYYFLDYLKYPYADYQLRAMTDLQNLVEQTLKKEFLFIGYRESAKSAIARGFVTWLVLYKLSPYILVGSYSQENAEANLFAVISAIQSNKRILNDFGILAPQPKSEQKGFNRIKKFLTSSGILLEAITTQQSPRGRLHKEQRPTFCLLDDIETMKTAMSEAITESTRNFIKELLPAMDSKDGRVLYLANHFSDIGVVQDLINLSERMYYYNVPIMVGDILAWPSKYVLTDEEAKITGKISIEEIKRRSNDSITFEQEYLNMPMSEERRIFKKSMFKYVKELPVNERLNCFIAIDPAFTTTTESDYTGIAIVWVDTKGLWYVKAYKAKISPKEIVDLLFNLYETYKPEKIGIEQISFTKGLKPFIDEEMRRRDKHFSIIELEHNNTHKNTRIQGLLSYFESDTIKLLEGQTIDLEQQLIRFPLGEHDDVADALAYITKMAYKPYQVTSIDHLFSETAQFPDIGL